MLPIHSSVASTWAVLMNVLRCLCGTTCCRHCIAAHKCNVCNQLVHLSAAFVTIEARKTLRNGLVIFAGKTVTMNFVLLISFREHLCKPLLFSCSVVILPLSDWAALSNYWQLGIALVSSGYLWTILGSSGQLKWVKRVEEGSLTFDGIDEHRVVV